VEDRRLQETARRGAGRTGLWGRVEDKSGGFRRKGAEVCMGSMSEEQPQPDSAPTGSAIQLHYKRLHSQCGAILETSIKDQNEAKVARSHLFAQEIELWASVLPDCDEWLFHWE